MKVESSVPGSYVEARLDLVDSNLIAILSRTRWGSHCNSLTKTRAIALASEILRLAYGRSGPEPEPMGSDW